MASFKNVRKKWVPEIKHVNPNVPFILVGTQMDLRGDSKLVKQKKNTLSVNMGEKLAEEVGAEQYLECSAKTREGLQDLFKAAVRATIGKTERTKSKKKGWKIKSKRICILL